MKNDIDPIGLLSNAPDAAPVQPAGRHVLARLLQFLDCRGFTEAAEEALERASPAELRELPDRHVPSWQAHPGMREAPADIARRYAAAARAKAAAPTAASQWRSLGPWTILNGQSMGGSARIDVSGRVSCLACDPVRPAHLLCGAASGGVWESFDRGASWAPRTDFMATLTVGALAFDPQAPSTVYCGTGEGNFYSLLGTGILRSTDGGTTWSEWCTAPFEGQGFYQIVVDPADSLHLLAATTGGLYTSDDAGVRWTLRRAVRTWSIAIAPGGELLAGCADGVYGSSDGIAWTAFTLPGAPTRFDRLAVATAPSDSAVAYAWGASGDQVLFYRRASGGWTAQTPPPGATTMQAWYDWCLACAPDRNDQVYCGGLNLFRGEPTGSGWSWQAIGDAIHVDHHALEFEPGQPGTLYAGNDGGVFRSSDRGASWAACNDGLVITEFEHLAQRFGSSYWILGGTQDNGTVRWTGDPRWLHVADGDGGDCAINRTAPSTVFHTFFNMTSERSTRSGDFGTWEWLPPPVPAGETSLFYPPFESSASGGDTVAIGGGALYISRDNMSNWVRLPFPQSEVASALCIPDPDNVIVGTQDGHLYRTRWDGGAWSALAALPSPRQGAVTDLLVVPGNNARIWITYAQALAGAGQVYRSDDGGASWRDCSEGLPPLPAHSIETDPLNLDRAWVALDVGVYQTLDAGATWTSFSDALPNAIVGDLVFHPYARVLRAATRNRGVWEIMVDGPMGASECGVLWSATLEASTSFTWYTSGWPATWHVIWTVMPATPAPGAPQLEWSVRVERSSAELATYWITVTNLTAAPTVIEGRYCILSKY